MSAHFDRALLLLSQSRHDLAEQEFRRALAEDPENPSAHACLALCMGGRGDWSQAEVEAEEGVRLGPDWAFTHFVRGQVLYHRNRHDEAERSVREALRLNPLDADYHSLLGAIAFDRGRNDEALRAVEAGLRHDPDHLGCANLRGIILVKLGRRDEADATLAGALQRDPENPLTHANQGWALLHQGDHQAALTHFRESLRLDPGLDWARAGMVEALKARNPVYRVLLRYFLWMSRQSSQLRWGIILAVAFGPRLLRNLGSLLPGIAPYTTAIAAVLLLLVYVTWIAEPLFNLLLRLDPYGRYALRAHERAASNWVGVCVLAALVGLLALAWTRSMVALIGVAYPALMVLPIAAAYSCAPGWPRRIGGGLAIGLGVLGGLALIALLIAPSLEPSLGQVVRGLALATTVPFLIGVLGSTWLSLVVPRVGLSDG